MDREGEILGQYKSISAKLKKRFLKKPNIAEGSDEFNSLARTLGNQGCPAYAGMVRLAQARCEHTLGCPAGEVEALVTAGRDFMAAERENRDCGAVSFLENLTPGVNCYSHAVRVLLEQKQSARAASLLVELADTLRSFDRPAEAIVHYHRASELLLQSPLACLSSLGKAAECRIQTGDYEGALSIVSEMAGVALDRGGTSATGCPQGAYCDVVARCEVDRLLLLLLLQPPQLRLKAEYSEALEKFAWEAADDHSHPAPWLDEELFLLLQSLAMAVQSRDLPVLRGLEPDLTPLLSLQQRHLLSIVVKNVDKGSVGD